MIIYDFRTRLFQKKPLNRGERKTSEMLEKLAAGTGAETRRNWWRRRERW
ncbi:hypothetical protein BVRB_5g125660 [Beta vulgaris subsp. vulgaris]|uniref:Uncharacterized protein n=1 Tax=Beta vulgaris subsp. vulgaris TaxID=3555 RepID=A0A0J8BCB5_BETVV|nr:hypothetical protein BVRB_5g125660 [Beta vulgaris subsp. vulgaris]